MTDSPQRIKYALWFSVGAEKRFLSHRETLRLWQRALTRAEAPVHFSCGFNPHMRLSLPLPRNVGVSSSVELLLLQLDESAPPPEFWARLGRQLPSGIDLKSVKEIPRGLNCNPAWARYQVRLREPVDRAVLSRRIEELQARPDWLLHRPARRRHPPRTIDVRGGVRDLEQDAEGFLCTIDIGRQATVRIDELFTVLEINAARQVTEIKRIAAGYPPELMMNINNI